jgi:hypothetical protein
VLAGLTALVVGGIALAAALDDDGDGSSAETIVTTVERTLPGTTVERPVTVTEESPPPPSPEPQPEPPPAPQPEPPPSGGGTVEDAVRLTDESTALNNAGDYAGGLERGQQALAILQGTGETYEGYANFNVGNALAHLGRCAEAIPYLDRRLQWSGGRAEVAQARALCTGDDGDD